MARHVHALELDFYLYTSFLCLALTTQMMSSLSSISYITLYTPQRNLYFSSPESFLDCGGRGFSARAPIALTMRFTSFFGMPSRSLLTDLRTRTLYLAIAL